MMVYGLNNKLQERKIINGSQQMFYWVTRVILATSQEIMRPRLHTYSIYLFIC
jgi:hypothetical protein